MHHCVGAACVDHVDSTGRGVWTQLLVVTGHHGAVSVLHATGVLLRPLTVGMVGGGRPGCYESMASVWSLSKVEQYDRTCARVSDLSPCGNRLVGGPEWLANQVNFQS